MKTSDKCYISLGALVLTVLFSACAKERSNIVLIIGDDISPDFSCFGGPVQTPHIDQLAGNGVLFENAYVTASSCSPSRSSIITGRYPHNTGSPELHMPLPEGQYLFPESLKDAGYYCVSSGKWHLGDYAQRAFDTVHDVPYPEEPTGSENWVQCLQDRPKDQPFFMWFAAYDAHRPWEMDTTEEPHRPEQVLLPAGVPDTLIAQQDVASYYDEVRRFDRYIGKVVAELKKQGVYENTLIIVLGDNGRPFARSKSTLYDGGMKTPLVVHWPKGKFETGSVSQSLVSSVDLTPLILEVAGLDVPPQVQGVSFLPVCRQADLQTREILYGERNWHVQRTCERLVRRGDFVYMRDFTPQSYSFQMVDFDKAAYAELLRLKAEGKLTPEQAEAFSTNRPVERLFDVSKDPRQLNNLAGQDAYKDVLGQMRELLADWQQRTGDSIPSYEEMTADRHDRTTFERLYPGTRPPTGILPGQKAGATTILGR